MPINSYMAPNKALTQGGYANESSASSFCLASDSFLIILDTFTTHSSGEDAGIFFKNLKASNILSIGILSDVI